MKIRGIAREKRKKFRKFRDSLEVQERRKSKSKQKQMDRIRKVEEDEFESTL